MEELLIECGEWILITLAILAAFWVLYQMLERLELTELIKRQVLKSPVPLLSALALGASVVVFVLILKTVVAHLNYSDASPPKENPAAEALHPKN